MKTSRGLKIYLVVVTALLIGAVGMGVYAWYVVQTLNSSSHSESPETPTPPGMPVSKNEPGIDSAQPMQNIETTTINVNSLSEKQQEVLRAFGMDADTITITKEMMMCAENAVGAERISEIVGGAAPTPLESLKLLPCFKK